MSDALQSLRGARAAIAHTLEVARKAGRSAFNDALAAFFARYPEILAFRWAQYTPYFNDGDECTFGWHSPEFRVVAHLQPPDTEPTDFLDPWLLGGGFSNRPPLFPDAEAAVREVDEMLALLDDDLLFDLFGDHTRVVCDRVTGISTELYDHD